MNQSPVAVRRATSADRDTVLALLTEAAEWLHRNGIDQWPLPFPVELVDRSIARGQTYVATIDGGPCGSITLYEDDELFWGPRSPDALYVHRLVVARSSAGAGLGATLLDWAAGHTRATGRDWLRLDCGADNPRMRRFYESLGFQHRGDTVVHVRGAGSGDRPWNASLYERSVHTHRSVAPSVT